VVEISLDSRFSEDVPFALEYLRSPYYISRMKGKREVMTARELARRINVPHTTVMGWLQKGQVPGAKAEEVGEFKVWVVPIETANTFPQWRPKRGRPTKKEAAKKAAKSGAKKSGSGK
jgi:hypothetical protein